jgi:hypothetical protein
MWPRTSCSYGAYVSDRLVGRTFAFDGATAADVSDAERALASFDARALALTSTEALARLLLRAESVASSHIEGLVISPQRLLRVALDRAEGVAVNDDTAIEVLGNVDAMSFAVQSDGDITVERLLEVHRRLLAPTRAAEHAGRIRDGQNWIGGSDYNPLSAAFVPPPANEVLPLLEDLCAFCNDDMLPAVAQAAIAHAQFETIPRSPTATAAPGARSSPWCSAGAGSHGARRRRSRWSSPRARKPTSQRSMRRASSVRRRPRKRWRR